MTGHDEEIQVPVLIVGGSLVGLSTALFLARHGVESLVAERHSGSGRGLWLLCRLRDLP